LPPTRTRGATVLRSRPCSKHAASTACFAVHDVSRGSDLGYNEARARTRFVPASTFKIANSLIGLTTGAVASVDEVLPYRATGPAFSPDWERDMGLRDAIVVSNVPI
jgi:beta-lactamase class D